LTDLCPANELADAFMAEVKASNNPDLCCVEALCELALDERFSAAALQSLYGRIIEPLCDDFTLTGVHVANLVLRQVIGFVRRMPQGEKMHGRLLALGFPDSVMLADRYERLLQYPSLALRDRKSIRRVLVLSRVTVGADIAITTIIVHRLLTALPDAELVLVGPSHLPQCFADLDRVRCLHLPYERTGSLVDRLVVWEAIDALVQQEHVGLQPGEMILVDPDSRLSQLGLLPLLAEDDTFFFPSRLNPYQQDNPTFYGLVNRWLDNLIGEQSLQPPVVSLPALSLRQGAEFFENLRRSGCRHIIVINCGVGGDDSKRLGEPFETQLPLVLLTRLKDTIVILDTGCAEDETKRVQTQLAEYRAVGLHTDFVHEAALVEKDIRFSHGAIGFHGSIGGIGSLIAGADSYFGYDSCCQHLAGALEIPSVIIFAGAPNERFSARWRPYDATGRTVVIPVADKSLLDEGDVTDLVERVAQAMTKIITKEK